MSRLCVVLMMTLVPVVTAWADVPLEILQDNYLGKPAAVDPTWELPYDRVTALSSETDTFAGPSWTADDLVVPPFQEFTVMQIRWIALLEEHPAPDYSHVEVAIWPANRLSDPIEPNQPSLIPSTVLEVDSMTSLNDGWGKMGFYEGIITLPEEMQVTLTEGHYYYAVRVVGNNLGRHMIATTGGDANYPDQNIFGGSSMGAFRSPHFYNNDWVTSDEAVFIADPNNPGTEIPYATDFAYQVWGVPEPASIVLLAVGWFGMSPTNPPVAVYMQN